MTFFLLLSFSRKKDCSSHYPNWRASYPERADKFVPGGFGENFVTARMNERNVCIGDVVSVGPEVVLQVSLPRQPCFKLNHRFSLKQFAPVTYQTSRTGWYYRVLREGTVRVGDELRLVERPCPKWTIERIQEYLHRDTGNAEMNEELSRIESLGAEAKGQFSKRVARARSRRDSKREVWKDYRIASRRMETPRVVSLVLEAAGAGLGADDVPSAGAHAKLKLPNGLVRTYSVVSGEGKYIGSRLELGVALDENSRGGSRYLHETARVGDTIQVGNVTTSVPPAGAASMHVFVAGGIGITAFVAQMRAYHGIHWDLRLHYAVRSADDVAFRERLEPLGDRVRVYDGSKGERMDVGAIVRGLPWNSHLYVCGPVRMMDEAKRAVREHGVSPDEVHFEAFAADVSGDAFEAEVAGGRVLEVGAEETLLEVLRREVATDVPSSCEVGNCGTCKVGLRSGRVDHRGTALGEEEKASAMLSCVSRGIGRIVLEL